LVNEQTSNQLSNICFAGSTIVWVNRTRSISSSSSFMLVLWQRIPLS